MMQFSGHSKSFLMMSLALLVLAGCATPPVQPPKIDRISEEELQRIMLRPIASLSLEEIVTLSKQGLSNAEIIEKIKASNSYYPLTPKEILKLNQQGLSGEVLEYMHASHEAKVQNNVAEEINKREQQKLEADEKLKREQLSCRAYDRFYPGFGWGGGFGRPYGWW